MQCDCRIPLYHGVEGGMSADSRKGYGDRRVTVPGGQCMACRIRLSRDWSVRAMHEASQFAYNIYATITYSDDYLPYGMNLDRQHLTDFHKRLRDRRPKMRMFYCGEYGDETDRPHYHGLYFNLRFDDQELMTVRNGNRIYRSDTFDKIWGQGHINYADQISPQSAQYVAGYTKKKTGKDKAEAYQWIDQDTGQVFDRFPEFKGQSLKPGIGYNWIVKNLQDVYAKDKVLHDGKEIPPPRYYDKVCEKLDPALWLKVKAKRGAANRQKEAEYMALCQSDKSKIPYEGSDRHGLTSERILESKKIARKEQ